MIREYARQKGLRRWLISVPAGPADPDAPEDTRGWVVVQFFNEEGEPLMARIKQYEGDFPRDRYPHRIDVFWPASEGEAAYSGTSSPVTFIVLFGAEFTRVWCEDCGSKARRSRAHVVPRQARAG